MLVALSTYALVKTSIMVYMSGYMCKFQRNDPVNFPRKKVTGLLKTNNQSIDQSIN